MNRLFELASFLSNFAGYKLVIVNSTIQASALRLKWQRIIWCQLLFVISLNGFSQFQPAPVSRSNNQISINGKAYYLHEVKKDQTLFGIAKVYGISEEEIKQINPDLHKKSVYPGMVLRIPDTGNSKDSNYLIHQVASKETLYSISKQYGIRMDDIRDLNPDVKDGLKVGMTLQIPKEKITIAQSEPIAKAPLLNDTNDLTKAKDDEIDTHLPCHPNPELSGNSYRIAVLLPLNLALNDTIAYADTLRPDHFRFFEFLEGVYMAMDSIRATGVDLTLEVHDTERDPEIIRQILTTGQLAHTDLIIGPVFPNELEVVLPFSRSEQIPMVSPFSTLNVVQNNPWAFQIRTKLSRQTELVTDYLGSRFNDNLTVICRLSEKNDPEFLRFMENLNRAVKQHDPSQSAVVSVIYYSETTRTFSNAANKATPITSLIPAASSSCLILSSENEVFITEVVNELYQLSTTRRFSVFGMNKWVFDKIDPGNLFNINLEFYSDFEDDDPFVDFSDAKVLDFNSKYNQNWNIMPSKYSFHGFDIAFYFARALTLFGKDLTKSIPCWKENLNHPTLLTPMMFQRPSEGSGYENQALTVVRYQKEELLRKRVN